MNANVDERALRQEARFFASLITKKLEQLNVCYRFPRSKSDFLERGVQRVKFDLAVTQADALWLRIHTLKLPRGISLADIDDETVLNDLAVACQRPIRFKRAEDSAWLIIERESGVFGIRTIAYDDVDKEYPETSLKDLLVPLGTTYNRRMVYKSIVEMPHALIGGATGSGKTTFQHAWICTLIQKNDPDDLRLVLIDLKGGTEFTRYQGVPHVDDFVKEDEDVIPALEALENEMKTRLTAFEERGGIQNLHQWNLLAATHPGIQALPRIVCFVDELSAVMLKKDLRKDAMRLFTTLGERGRAPGIHLVLCTQRPVVRVVDGQIKGNLDARFAFRMTDDTSSTVVLDTTEAARFPEDTPPGRYIYKSGLDRLELQSPLIEAHQIQRIVRAVIAGDKAAAKEASQVSPEAVFRASLLIGGTFAVKKLYKAMDGRASKRFIEALAQDYEGQVIELDGVSYKLLPPEKDGVFKPRRLVPLAELLAEATALANSENGRDGDGGTGDVPVHVPQNTHSVPQNDAGVPQESGFSESKALQYAIDELDGALSCKQIYKHFKGEIRYVDLVSIMAAYDEKTVEVYGDLYYCEPGVGRRPRRLVLVSEVEASGERV